MSAGCAGRALHGAGTATPSEAPHQLPWPVEDSIKQSAGTAIGSPFMTALSLHTKHFLHAPQFQFPLKDNGGSLIYLPRNLSEGEYLGVEHYILGFSLPPQLR